MFSPATDSPAPMTTDNYSDIAQLTNTSLIRRVKSGEQEAWESFVRIYAPLIYSRCRSGELNPEEAADAMQEVFLRVHKGIAAYRPQKERASFRSWLRTVAAHTVVDHFREVARQHKSLDAATLNLRLRSLEESFSEESFSSSDHGAAGSESRHLIVNRIMQEIRGDYEERTWDAFWRTTIDGQKATEVAAELNMTPGAVRTAKYTVCRRLREELNELL
ncbi:MAG: sigma-70 family RNA polymerase sigma factor [Planctomycetaceae bacterium]|nr:sigma-70 family RNA polymerase sigma factor [Planctomycetaceae bacterium]